MSNYDHSDFFREPTEEEHESKTAFELYLAKLNEEQIASLDDFYRTYCNPGHGKNIVYPDGRKFDTHGASYGRTKHNIFFALNQLAVPHAQPTDYSLQTLQKKGDEMLNEEYKVVAVKHVLRAHEPGMDKIVYAEGSKRVALELGRRVYWIEKMIVEDQEIELPFPVEPFRITETTPA